nr:ShlB/FhaC/HecB family hemolysin secretion/activation protein [Desulfobulbaceae bacterium]
YTKGDFISKRIDVASDDLIDLKVLESEIVQFNRIWDVQIRAELKPGQKVGTSDYNLIADEPAQYELIAFADNAGSKVTGRERLGAFFKDASLFGYRDQLTIGAVVADGTESGSFMYSVPISTKGARFDGSYNFNQIEVKSGPFEPLQITGDSSDVGGRLSHPLLVDSRKKLSVFAEYHRKKSTTEYAGIINGEVISRDTGMGVDYEYSTDNGFWKTRHTFTHGRDNDQDDLQFLKYNGDLVWMHRVNEKMTSVVKASGQLADSELLPAFDQFQLGGTSSVRGYTEGALSGDQGYYVSAEINVPLKFSGEAANFLNNQISGFGFVDHGGAFPFKAGGASINHDDFLTSVGCGLDFSFSKWLSGRLHFAVPLGEREPDQADVRVHFYLQSNIF